MVLHHFNMKRLVRAAIATATAAATLTLGSVAAGTALADPAKPNVNADGPADGIAFDIGTGYDEWMGSYYIGTHGEEGYCFDSGIAASQPYIYATMNWAKAPNAETANRVGWVLHEAYKPYVSSFTPEQQKAALLDKAAAAYIVHDRLDNRPADWAKVKTKLNGNRNLVGHGWYEMWSYAAGGHYVADFTAGQVIDRACHPPGTSRPKEDGTRA